MLKRYLLIVGIFAGLLFISCGTRADLFQGESMSEKNWGRSYETAKYNQILNPDASKNLEPVVDLDGQAADNNVEKYRDSFKEKGSRETVNVLKLQ